MIQSHHLPTCDDVFEVLTRAPFPTGQHEVDFPIERHLTVCHSCRELAEALRPVTAVLAEGQADEADSEVPLPVFLADCRPARLCGLNVQSEQKETGNWWKIPGPLVGLAVCLLVLVTASGSWLASQQNPSHGTLQPLGQLPPTGRSMLPNFKDAILPVPSCSLMAVQNFEAQAPSKRVGNGVTGESNRLAQELSDQQCCSQCHHAAGQSTQPEAKFVSLAAPQLKTLVNHCMVCHAK